MENIHCVYIFGFQGFGNFGVLQGGFHPFSVFVGAMLTEQKESKAVSFHRMLPSFLIPCHSHYLYT